MNEFDWLALGQSSVLLSKLEGVELLGDWEPAAPDKVWMLPLRLMLLGAEPSEKIPVISHWAVVINFKDDAWGKVQVHPSLGPEGLSSTFAHQQYNGGPHPQWPVRNGHICSLTEMHGLATSRNAVESEPVFTTERIVWHVERTQEWLQAAAADKLVKAGDPFELPDFGIFPAGKSETLAYYEDAISFGHWRNSSEYAGIASISEINNTKVIRQFKDRRSQEIMYEPSWGTYIKQLPARQSAIWLRLDEIPVLNVWQVPTTFAQLTDVLAQQGKKLEELLRPLLPRLQATGEWLLFLGIPIPKRVPENPYRYHWQALVLSPMSKNIPLQSRINMTLGRLHSSSDIPWISRGENWHPENLQSRGRVDSSLQEAKVLLIGAGALGANLAELLVRMGVCHLTIVDCDQLEAGNLVRHPLDLAQLNMYKAQAIAERLNRSNPSAQIHGLTFSVPAKGDLFAEAVKSATLILDVTASDGVLRELPLQGLSPQAVIITLSLGLHAQRLFFYADQAVNFDFRAFEEWFWPFREEEHQAAQQQEMPRGIGCWHPLTPARLNRIVGLAGVGIELIEQVCVGETSLPIGYCHLWQVPELKLILKEEVEVA